LYIIYLKKKQTIIRLPLIINTLLNQETTKAIRFVYNLSIFRPISALIIPTPFNRLILIFLECFLFIFFYTHILFHFCVGTRVWRIWNLQSKNNFKVDFSSAAILHWPFSSVIDRNRNQPFNLIQNKVGYRSCLATGVKLEQFLWNSVDVK
jgi:hypothetical protein